MITIQDFWRVDDHIEAKWGKVAYKHIDYCGLIPVRPLERHPYFCTPKNSLTFAATGGDGVHYGMVQGVNQQGHPGPVVMTVPMATNNNVIVAEDLDEFFSLGYYAGWSGLDEIVYRLDEAIKYYAGPDADLSKEESTFLEMIRKEFQIQHIPLTKKRLEALEKLYFHQLDIGNLEDWEAQF